MHKLVFPGFRCLLAAWTRQLSSEEMKGSLPAELHLPLTGPMWLLRKPTEVGREIQDRKEKKVKSLESSSGVGRGEGWGKMAYAWNPDQAEAGELQVPEADLSQNKTRQASREL